MPNFLVTFSSLFSCTFNSNQMTTSQGLGCLIVHQIEHFLIRPKKYIACKRFKAPDVVRKNNPTRKASQKLTTKTITPWTKY